MASESYARQAGHCRREIMRRVDPHEVASRVTAGRAQQQGKYKAAALQRDGGSGPADVMARDIRTVRGATTPARPLSRRAISTRPVRNTPPAD